jgi:hypothetical protein
MISGVCGMAEISSPVATTPVTVPGMTSREISDE